MTTEQLIQSFIAFNRNAVNNFIYTFSSNTWFIIRNSFTYTMDKIVKLTIHSFNKIVINSENPRSNIVNFKIDKQL